MRQYYFRWISELSITVIKIYDFNLCVFNHTTVRYYIFPHYRYYRYGNEIRFDNTAVRDDEEISYDNEFTPFHTIFQAENQNKSVFTRPVRRKSHQCMRCEPAVGVKYANFYAHRGGIVPVDLTRKVQRSSE